MDPSRGPKRARPDDYPSGHHPIPPVPPVPPVPAGATYDHVDYNDYSSYSDFNPQGTENQNHGNQLQSHAAAPRLPPSSPATTSSAAPQRPPEDFSAVIKNKLQSCTRTGQACDRCKVRKIRCDALPEGCSHCRGQNLECYVTDRITGRTERRGYLQDLEREKVAMANHIKHLEELLKEQAGADVLPWKWSPFTPACPPGVTLDSKGNAVQDDAKDVPWERAGTVWWKPGPGGVTQGQRPPSPGDANAAVIKDSSSAPTPTLLSLASTDNNLQSQPIDNCLGVFADRAPLNSVNGTQVSILGTVLNIDVSGADREPEPSATYHEPTGLYNRSLGSFLRSSMNVDPPVHVDLPSRSDAFEYSEWFFLMVHPFAPILHKPSYLALLTSIYDDYKFAPTISQLATVHLVFAAIYFQYGVRNRDQVDRHMHLDDLSNKHYHWALSKFYHILSDRTVTSVQALVLITLYTRAFPKPGCGSTIASFSVMKAVDLGLHRTSGIPDAQTNLANEMRKRAWWLALMLCVTLNGRLGRPMPIRAEDFDIEMPMAISDEYLTDDGITDRSMIGKPSFLVALHAIKFTTLYMDMFSYLYGARRDPRRYGALVRQLEAQHDAIQANLPQELHIDGCKPTHIMYALYAHAVSLEFMLCLRHPSACMTSDPQVFAENTRICEETARKLLRHVQRLLELKSLDTTWYQMSVYCAAMFSTLAAAWERRHTATASDLEQLQDETSIWLSILAEMNMLAGAADDGQLFNSKLTQICARTIFGILRDMPPAARKAVMANNALLTPKIAGTKRKAARSAAHAAIAGHAATAAGSAAGGGADGAGPSAHDEYSYGNHGSQSSHIAGGGAGGSISSVDGTTSGSGTPSTRYSPGNVDSVALHLETQARMMFDSRREPVQQAPAVPLTMPPMSTAAVPVSAVPVVSSVPAVPSIDLQLSSVPHPGSAQYDVGGALFTRVQNASNLQNMQNVQNVQMQQTYTHHPHPLRHMDMANINDYTRSPQQHLHQQPAMLYSTAPPVSSAVAPVARDQAAVPPNTNSAATNADMAAAAAAVAAANPWTNWAASINDTQSHDQFNSANALLDLSMLHHRLAPGLSTTDTGPDASGADAAAATAVSHMVSRGGVSTHHVGMQAAPQSELDSHAAQWPLMLFTDNVSGV